MPSGRRTPTRPPARPWRSPAGGRSPRPARCPGPPGGGPARPTTAAPGTPGAPPGIDARTCRAPWSSISSSTGVPVGQPVSHGAAGGAVEVPGELRVLEQLAALDHAGELRVVDEPVVDAVGLPRPGTAGRRRHRQPDLGVWSRTTRRRPCSCPTPLGPDRTVRRAVRRHRTPARARRPGWCRGRGPGGLGDLEPFHDLRARTLPTPGIDSSRADTFILPMMSSCCPSAITSPIEAPECLSRFFTSARTRRASAAFSSAAARCSGVRGGRATAAFLSSIWRTLPTLARFAGP
jgi:hypothetical protein